MNSNEKDATSSQLSIEFTMFKVSTNFLKISFQRSQGSAVITVKISTNFLRSTFQRS